MEGNELDMEMGVWEADFPMPGRSVQGLYMDCD